MLKYALLIISVTLFTGNTRIAKNYTALSCKEVTLKMIKAIASTERLKYNLKTTERGKNGNANFESSVKLNRTPRKLYINLKGVEILWIKGMNGEKALVNPNAFPYVNLNLDPFGSLMRKDQHHTIHEMGFDYFGDIIDYGMKKTGDKFDTYAKLEEEKYNTRACYKISMTNKDYAKITYTVTGTKETVVTIARKLRLSEYRILELNPTLEGYETFLKKGQVLTITNWYAKEVVMYIDKLYFLPIGIKVSDDKGLFEQYDYNLLQVNPKFADDEFSEDYKDYKF